MIGKIARTLKEISSNKLEIPRIVALDPASPGFESSNMKGFDPISKTDATYVQIIHTCIGKLGMQGRAGHIDFFPNGGIRHPGCDENPQGSMLSPGVMTCDHARSYHFYQASVRDPRTYPAVRCESWSDFLNNGTCYREDIAYMGFGAEPR